MEHKRPVVKVRCANCKKWCVKERHHVNYAKVHSMKMFCNKKCRDQSLVTGAIFSCSNCNKKIWRTPAQQKRTKSGRVFCSKHCATIHNNRQKVGPKHPNYKGTNYRKLGLRIYGPKCALCAYSNEIVLQVHHRDHNRKNNTPENLIVLCPTHHWEVHLGVTKI